MKTWWKEAVGYQIVPQTFCDSNGDGIGDLRGIVQKLDVLQELGVDLLWLGPIFRSPMADDGYDVSDYRSVNPLLGTMEDLQELIRQVHARGMRIILDLVLNHTSDQHPWFQKARKDRSAPEHDYYLWQKGRIGAHGEPLPPTNWASFFSDSAWCYNEATDEYFLKIFSDKMPDLNWSNPALRQEMKAIARFWLDQGIDGFRIDAAAHLAKKRDWQDSPLPPNAQGWVPDWSQFSNLPELFDYLDELKREVFDQGDWVMIGEVGGGASVQTALNYVDEQNGALNMVFTMDHCWANGIHASQLSLSHQARIDVVALKKTFAHWIEGMSERAWLPVYWLNHDHPRVVSQYGDPHRYHRESATMLEQTLLLMRGTPFLYNGEEIGMTNDEQAQLEDFHDVWVKNMMASLRGRVDDAVLLDHFRRTSRDNARSPMQWSDQPYAGFSTVPPKRRINPNYTRINVQAQRQDPHSIWRHVQRTLALRKDPAWRDLFVYGSFQLVEAEHPQLFAYCRRDERREVWVISNFTAQPASIRLPQCSLRCLLANYPDSDPHPGDNLLRPYESLAVLIGAKEKQQ